NTQGPPCRVGTHRRKEGWKEGWRTRRWAEEERSDEKPLSLSLRRQHSCVRGGPAIWNCSRPVLQGQACSIASEHPMMFGSAEKLPYCRCVLATGVTSCSHLMNPPSSSNSHPELTVILKCFRQIGRPDVGLKTLASTVPGRINQAPRRHLGGSEVVVDPVGLLPDDD
ncbi:hypothetical protein KUCAC02_001244, partial [Chaenocephalus aceratus]